MTMKHIIPLFFAAALAVSCEKTEEPIIAGADANIISCTVTAEEIYTEAYITGNTVEASLPADTDPASITVEITLSEKATISPDPSEITDWTKDNTFTVTSANGDNAKEYTIRIKLSDDENIGNISARIGNQEALNRFAENRFTTISSLMLYDDMSGDPITDLSGLSSIREVRAEIEIQEISAKEISFPNLTTVGNFDMHSISAEKVLMPKLTNVAGRFRIGNNDSGPMPTEHTELTEIDLSSLKSVGRSLIIFWCINLEELKLDALEGVGEDLIVSGGNIKSLEFMKAIKSINGALAISLDLESLDGFSVETIKTGLSLSLSSVKSLEPLSVLKSVPYISLFDGNELTSFKGLEHLNLNAIDIKNFPKIESLEYLPIRNGMEHIQLTALTSLKDLKGFESITEIGDLYLVNCTSLEKIDEISGLSSVNNMTIQLMEGLDRLPDFNNLQKVNGKLTISMMTKLADISGIGNITEVAALQIDNLLALPSLNGLENLKKVTNGGITIGNLPLITDLDPLSGLEEVNMPAQSDLITITMNKELVSYSGMAELLIRYWNSAGGKFPKVSITENKYNPTYEQLVDGQWEMPE